MWKIKSIATFYPKLCETISLCRLLLLRIHKLGLILCAYIHVCALEKILVCLPTPTLTHSISNIIVLSLPCNYCRAFCFWQHCRYHTHGVHLSHDRRTLWGRMTLCNTLSIRLGRMWQINRIWSGAMAMRIRQRIRLTLINGLVKTVIHACDIYRLNYCSTLKI